MTMFEKHAENTRVIEYFTKEKHKQGLEAQIVVVE